MKENKRSQRGGSALMGLAAASVLGASAAMAARQIIRKRRRMDLRGRSVVIMGGSRGLGLALAREYAAAGARLALCARGEGELSRAQTDLARLGAHAATFCCDGRNAEEVSRTIRAIEQRQGEIDVLVNCAGTIVVGPAEAMQLEDYRQVMATNFWSALHAILAVVPGMKKRGGGRIINVGSIGGKMPVPHLAAYCASKFALVGLSGVLAAELRKENIFVTVVNPGLMRTGSPRNAFFKGKARAEYAWFSLSDGTPGLSMSATSAARRIVKAGVYGEAAVAIGLPAKVGSRVYGLMPGMDVELAALAARLMPGAEGGGKGMRRGHQSESLVTRSFLTALNRRAEADLNQRGAKGG